MFSYNNTRLCYFILIEIISKKACYSFNFNSSYITLKIKGSGIKNIFCPTDSFHEENRPEIIKINN